MAVHLVRNGAAAADAPGAVPDRRMVPWAATRDGRVVWSLPAALGRPSPSSGLLVQRERRALAETALAQIVIRDPKVAGDALRAVSRGMVRYCQQRRRQLDALASARGFTEHRQYAFGDTSLGRVGTPDQIPAELDAEIRCQLAALFSPKAPER
ncbi:MAG: hypothetical protein K2W96_04375 [Gemmataceae bacterium]|nr:hypothetical protein [Gemmataceae bacterium]